MFYVKEKVNVGVYSIVDTNDNTVDECSILEIKKFYKLGISIEGVERKGKTLVIKPITKRYTADNIAFEYMDNNFSLDKVKGVAYKRYPIRAVQYNNAGVMNFMKSTVSNEDAIYTVTIPYALLDKSFIDTYKILPISEIITIAFYKNELKTKKVVKKD